MIESTAYQTAKTAFSLYGAFFQKVSAEIGYERALALHCELGVPYGRQLAGALRERAGVNGLDGAAMGAVQEAGAISLGCVPALETAGNVARMTVRICPVYDGLCESGLDHATIEAFCRGMSAAEFAVLQEAWPDMRTSLEFRSSAECACVEEWALP